MKLNIFRGGYCYSSGYICPPVEDKAVHETYEGEFIDICAAFEKHTPTINKKDEPLFSFWDYKSPNEIDDPNNLREVNDVLYAGAFAVNATFVHAIVVDYDKGKRRIEAVNEKFKFYNRVLYTSHSHDPQKHAFRLIIPLKKPVDQETWRKKKDALLNLFNGCDDRSFDVSRLFHLPSCDPQNIKNSKVIEKHGLKDFDLFSLPDNKVKQIIIPVSSKEISDEELMGLIKRLENVRLYNEPAWANLAVAYISLGLSESDYVYISQFVMKDKTSKQASSKYNEKLRGSFRMDRGGIKGFFLNCLKGEHCRKCA